MDFCPTPRNGGISRSKTNLIQTRILISRYSRATPCKTCKLVNLVSPGARLHARPVLARTDMRKRQRVATELQRGFEMGSQGYVPESRHLDRRDRHGHREKLVPHRRARQSRRDCIASGRVVRSKRLSISTNVHRSNLGQLNPVASGGALDPRADFGTESIAGNASPLRHSPLCTAP